MESPSSHEQRLQVAATLAVLILIVFGCISWLGFTDLWASSATHGTLWISVIALTALAGPLSVTLLLAATLSRCRGLLTVMMSALLVLLAATASVGGFIAAFIWSTTASLLLTTLSVIAGFGVVVSLLLIYRGGRKPRYSPLYGNRWRRWQSLSRRTIKAIGVLAGLALLIAMLSANVAGLPANDSYPILAPRPSYLLHSHARSTHVSRWRFVVVSVSSQVAFSAGGLLMTLGAFHYSCFGENLSQDKNI